MPTRKTKEEYFKALQNLAKMRGGKLLSKRYLKATLKLRWQCKNRHVWSAIPNNVKRGAWCPICGIAKRASKQRKTLEQMQDIAKTRNGESLSSRYINATTNLKWKCNEGHTWEATPGSITGQKSWCPYCAGKKIWGDPLKLLQKQAKKLGGICLSKKYVNATTKMLFQCKRGHTWKTTLRNMRAGHWCPYCSNRQIWGGPIKELKAIAHNRGGKLLSTKYINNRTKLRWECRHGHIWEAASEKIKMGRWCPICASNISERICRIYFETIFNKPFKKTRPIWLKTEKGHRLELDGYNNQLRIAFEHHGNQHFVFNKFFYKDNSFFKKRVAYDKLKRRLCKHNKVKLFEISQISFSTNFKDLEEQIAREAKRLKVKLPHSAQLNVPLEKIYYGHKNELFDELKSIALSKHGKLLSKGYLRGDSKLKWKCKEGHVWEAVSRAVQGGTWCPYCSGNTVSQNIIPELKEIASKRGGLLLSKSYVNAKTKLEWQCAKNHVWRAVPSSIKLGYWCPHCAGNRIWGNPLQELKQIARENGGECLSNSYVNSHSKIKWRCKKGHTWYATAGNIRGNASKKGTWCPECAKPMMGLSKRLSLNDFKKLAKSRDGKCLSTKYVNSHTNLKWKCKNGHVWEATPGSIKSQGSWCPYCARKVIDKENETKILEKIAKSKGGKLISKSYVNYGTKLTWACSAGHQWKAIPYNIKLGHWCPKCSLSRAA